MKSSLNTDNDGYYWTFSELDSHPVIAAFGTRKLNTVIPDERKKFLERLRVNYQDLVSLEQVHGSRAAFVGELDMGSGALDPGTAIKGTDGAVTATAGAPIAVYTADCLSIFFYDPRNNAVGICHAGWRGTGARIAQQTVKTMQSKCWTNPGELLIAIGPGIRKCCYTVGEELIDYFPASIERRRGAYYLDLLKENVSQLLSSGAKEKKIFDSEFCTSCRNDLFFSYRREKENAGRMMSVVMLK